MLRSHGARRSAQASLVATLLQGCSPGTPEAEAAPPVVAPESARRASPTDASSRGPETAGAPAPAAPEVAAPSAAAPADLREALCRPLCLQRSQMRAVAAEMIESDCAAECRTPAGPDRACEEAVAKARRGVEAVPMPRRATRVLAALADPAVSCGNADPVLTAIAAAAAEADLERRDAALGDALKSDPWLELVCPAAGSVLDDLGALPEPVRSAHLARECPLHGSDPEQGVLRDIGPMTLLAERTIAARWAVYGATTSHHEILLDTLLLASGLERDARR